MAKIIGGGRLIKFYTVTNTGTTFAVGSTAVFECAEQINTDVAFDDQGIATITIEQIQDDATLGAFIEAYGRPTAASSGTPEDITYENGDQLLGAAGTGTPLLAIVKGGTISGGATKIYAGIVNVARSSGSWSQSGNTYNRPTLVAVAQACETDGATIASTYFSSFANTSASASAYALNKTSRKYGGVTYM